MFGTDYFQIIHGEPVHVGELTPTGFTSPAEKGMFMQREGAEHCKPATSSGAPAAGFLTKQITDDGPTFEKMTLGYPDLPAKTGQKVTLGVLPDGSLIEVEGQPSKAHNVAQLGHLVTSGTGAISTSTAAETEVSLQSGRFRVAQSGDYVEGVIKRQVDPVADASNVRVAIEIRRQGKKA